MNSLIRTSLVLLVLFTGCAAQKFQMKAYDGADRAEDQVALLKPYIGTMIRSIDGSTKYAIKPMRPGLPNLDIDISLLPGEHVLVVGYELYGVNSYESSAANQSVRFEARAGRRYLLNARAYEGKWEPYIEDVTDIPSKWCWNLSECGDKNWSSKVPVREK